LWLAVALVVMCYLSFLAYSIIKPKAKRSDTKPSKTVVAVTPTNTVQKPATVNTEPVPEPEPVISTASRFDSHVITGMISRVKASGILIEEGRRLARNNQFARAELKYEEAAGLMPEVYTLLYEWAGTMVEQKRWSSARDVLIRALNANPSSADARLMLARACYELKRPDEALALANWVLEVEPYSEGAHQIAADVLTAMDQHEAAIKHLQKLVAIDSSNHTAENGLGAAMMSLGQFNQAIRAFENVIRDEPGNSQAYYYLAICYIRKNEPELSVDVLSRATSRFGQPFVLSWTKSSDFDSLRNLASFQQQFGESAVATSEPVLP
jgi:tetratricopeptide (TPR) repeat protein